MSNDLAERHNQKVEADRAKAALRQRVEDIAAGATGGVFAGNVEAWRRIRHAIQVQFDTGDIPDNMYIWDADFIDNITSHLYSKGCRA